MYIDSIKFSLRVKNNVSESDFFLPVGKAGLCKYTWAQTACIYKGGGKHSPVIGQMFLHWVPQGYRPSSPCVESWRSTRHILLAFWKKPSKLLSTTEQAPQFRIVNVDLRPLIHWFSPLRKLREGIALINFLETETLFFVFGLGILFLTFAGMLALFSLSLSFTKLVKC